MDATGLFAVEKIVKLSALLAGVSAAFFAVFDVAYGGEQKAVRDWFRRRWQTVGAGPWLQMPEGVIAWALGLERRCCPRLWWVFSYRWFRLTSGVLTLGLLEALAWVKWSPAWAAVLLLAASGIVGVFAIVSWRTWVNRLLSRKGIVGFAVWLAWCVCVLSLVLAVVLLIGHGMRLVLKLNTPAALIASLAVSPAFLLVGANVFDLALQGVVRRRLSSVVVAARSTPLPVDESARIDRWLDAWWMFWRAYNLPILLAWGTVAGLNATLLAFLVGQLARPSAWVPQTWQMLAVNAICDGLTLVATLSILSWTTLRRGFIRIPMAVLIATAAGALLAFASLYLGLIGTERALSALQVLNVLIARSPDGRQLDLGPCFWAMHTTFLPIFGYLVVVLVCWLAKALLIPVHWVLGRGQEIKNPLKLTAALCTLVAAVLLLVAGAIGTYREQLERGAPVEATARTVMHTLSSGRSERPDGQRPSRAGIRRQNTKSDPGLRRSR